MTETQLPDCLASFPSVTPIDVAWGDMDAFGHVNNTRYFRYFETARIAYFTVINVLEQRIGPITASTSCRFRAPVTFPDRLLVGARLLEFQGDRFGHSERAIPGVGVTRGCECGSSQLTVVLQLHQ